MTTQTRGTEEQVHLKNKYLANCDNEANRAGVKASLVAAAGCLGADYLFTKNWHAYAKQKDRAGKILAGAVICYGVFYTVNYFTANQCRADYNRYVKVVEAEHGLRPPIHPNTLMQTPK